MEEKEINDLQAATITNEKHSKKKKIIKVVIICAVVLLALLTVAYFAFGDQGYYDGFKYGTSMEEVTRTLDNRGIQYVRLDNGNIEYFEESFMGVVARASIILVISDDDTLESVLIAIKEENAGKIFSSLENKYGKPDEYSIEELMGWENYKWIKGKSEISAGNIGSTIVITYKPKEL